jgi:hypothetical protein
MSHLVCRQPLPACPSNQRYYSGQPKNRLQTLHELIKLLSDIAYKLVSKFLAQTQSLPEGGRW